MNKKVFNQALKERKLVRFSGGVKLVKKELKAAKADYESEYSSRGAKYAIGVAKDFIKATEGILG